MAGNKTKADVIVVGGGLAGLAAATLLARKGIDVLLLEKSHSVGGRAQTRTHDGFFLNLGPHALYRAGKGIEVLRALGVEPHGGVPRQSGAYAVKQGRKHTLPAGPVSLLTTSLLSLPAKIEAARLLAEINKLDTGPLMGSTVNEWAVRALSHEQVREFVKAVIRVATYADAPEVMSAGAALEQVKLASTQGVLYLDYGWQSLVDGLLRSAESAGVRVSTGARANRVIRAGDGSAAGVELTDGSELFSSYVILSVPPANAASLADDGASTLLNKWASNAIPVRAATLDVGLEKLPRPEAKFALGIDSPLYLSAHSAVARLTPQGNALIHVAKYLAPDREQEPSIIERDLEGLLDLVQPGWREVVVYRRFLPDLVVSNALPDAARGGTNGRPGPVVDDVPGLYVIGDWVGPEGLLADASLASARTCAEIVAARISANGGAAGRLEWGKLAEALAV